ncbi:DUF4883 family protein [Haloimpatiens lingqiaonensis]|uniref:DUF4883 family protein n=1 Tax=Haloimpatiens lingqiaonensis TaxID=1380675 RepID=UPI0010FDF651|nr:DUF4883 family protein [Haloimpatiens lingqiaonensis]
MRNAIKSFLFCLLILLSFTLAACSYIKLNNEKTKEDYYFSKLANSIALSNKYKITLLDTNFYKVKELKEEDVSTILNFMNSIDKKNFIKKPLSLPEKPQYKIFFNLDENKFVINVYDEQYVSIFPWDGKYPMDYIDMTPMYKGYNLYNFCKYLIPNDME